MALRIKELYVMNGTNIVFDTCAVIKLVEQKAIEIRRSTSVKLPDCIVAATSIILDAILLTDDKHLLNLSWPGLRTLHIL